MMELGRRVQSLFLKNIALLLLLLCFLLFSLLTQNFFSVNNILGILKDTSILGIIVCGLTFVIIAGGIDLSLGAMLGLSGLIFIRLISLNLQINAVIIVLLPLLCVLFFSLINGLLFTKLEIPPLIATLAMMTIITGIRMTWFRKEIYLDEMARWLYFISKGSIKRFPVSVIIFIIIIIVSMIILYKTPLGRRIYIVGANEKSAILTGLNIDNIRIFTFLYLGLLVTISSILVFGKIKGYSFTIGQGYEMEAIFAAVLGGTVLTGGKGRIEGSVAGVLLMSTLRNGFTLAGVGYSIQEIVVGSIFIIFIIIQNIFKKFI